MVSRSGIARGARLLPLLPLLLLAAATPARAHDLTDRLSAGGVIAAAEQCAPVREDAGDLAACRAAVSFQPSVSLRASESSELFVKLGLAAGNGLSATGTVAPRAWAADLEDDLDDINGRWGHLLNAWLRYRFELSRGAALTATAGVIDATDFLDDNACAGDEYTQFMNEALVNSRQALLPGYDVGGAVELQLASWSLRAVAMRVGENSDGRAYTFGGGQLGYTLATPLGIGHYRVFVSGSSADFQDPTGSERRAHIGGGLSVDQKLGRSLGAFLRVGWQGDGPAIEYRALYSGGLQLQGHPWGRPADAIGVGYAFLDGGNSDLSASHVAELYYRLALFDFFAVTADAQLLEDRLVGGGRSRVVALGLRWTGEF